MRYDTPFEVTEKQYGTVMNRCSGLVCGRRSEGKFYIKLWMIQYRDYVEKVLNH